MFGMVVPVGGRLRSNSTKGRGSELPLCERFLGIELAARLDLSVLAGKWIGSAFPSVGKPTRLSTKK